jgi:hypothetical protein
MKLRLLMTFALIAVALTFTGSAFAFDCIRVSASFEGLQRSTANSGKWALIDLSGATRVQETVEPLLEITISDNQ